MRKNLLNNVCILFCVLLFILLSNSIYSYFMQITMRTFQLGKQELSLFIILILFGALLGIENYIYQRGITGVWSINVMRVFILLLPCFILTIWIWLPKLLLIFNINYSLPIPVFLFLPSIDLTLLKLLLPILTGYITITTISKKK